MGRLFIVAVSLVLLGVSACPDAGIAAIAPSHLAAPATKKKAVSATKPAAKKLSKSTSRITKKKKTKRNKKRAARKKAKKKAGKIMFTGRFIWSVPDVRDVRLSSSAKAKLKERFWHADANDVSPTTLARAGVFSDEPLRGGIFVRRDAIKYIILHSTETERIANARRVIKSWNRGLSHPGTQYVVDRDGVIYQTVDPQFGTVHVNVNKTLYGVNNDNSVGIEMVRAEQQKYTKAQLASISRLVAYLQGRFAVADEKVLGHGEIQPSDRLDPVGFDWRKFKQAKSALKEQVVAYRHKTRSAAVRRSDSSS